MCEYNNIEKRREVLLWQQKKLDLSILSRK